MGKVRKIIVATTMVIVLSSCAGCIRTVYFPICTSLSKTKPSAIPGIGKSLFDVCTEKGIHITILSSTIAEFSGPKSAMRWLQKNYHILICDFDQSAVAKDESMYTTCMANSEKWIQIVQGARPQDLMNSAYSYPAVCVE